MNWEGLNVFLENIVNKGINYFEVSTDFVKCFPLFPSFWRMDFWLSLQDLLQIANLFKMFILESLILTYILLIVESRKRGQSLNTTILSSQSLTSSQWVATSLQSPCKIIEKYLKSQARHTLTLIHARKNSYIPNQHYLNHTSPIWVGFKKKKNIQKAQVKNKEHSSLS